jgi:hypothetical protein
MFEVLYLILLTLYLIIIMCSILTYLENWSFSLNALNAKNNKMSTQTVLQMLWYFASLSHVHFCD